MATAQTTRVGANGRASALPAGVHDVTSQDGTRISVAVSGQGPPLVVVWGAMGTKDSAFAKPMHAEFAKTFTVYAYDRRGRGQSGDKLPYAVEREIEDLAAVCAATGTQPTVIGFSSGAALALLAAASGVKMSRLIAQEPPYYVEGSGKPFPADYEQKVKALVAADDRDGAVAYFMRVVGVPAPMVWMMRLMPFWKEARAAAHTLPYDAAILSGFKMPTATFARIRVPTLVVYGSKTPNTLKESSKLVAATVPGSTIVEMPKQNHGVKPRVIAPIATGFAASETPRAAPAAVATAQPRRS